ncbi:hypothetical protein JMG10_02975 [Nostoc ellipsosporum NOK]|nr:hypothetical protein [Nostoc ellipsosporum NOK]
MQGKIYTKWAVLGLAAVLLLPLAVEAQRRYYPGRYPGRIVRYHRPPAVRYYPPRVYSYYHPYATIGFGGISYRYQRGYFYRPYGASFQLIAPPIGIRIGTLPVGYRRMYVGPDEFYYYNNVYYRSNRSGYEVVAPPLGAELDELPPGAQAKVIDGKKYYETDGTYYEEEITETGLSYRVVGTNGVLNTTGVQDSLQDDEREPAGPQEGDRFDELPAGSQTVTIRGEKLYVSPSGLYYKEVTENKRVVYEVVGK